MKNRVSYYVIAGMIVLAIIGLLSTLISDPAGFLQRIAVMLVIGAAVFFLIRRFNSPNPANRDQRAFVKAAKKSVKRNQKDTTQHVKKKKHTSLTPIKKTSLKKKHSNPQLKVIEGKKGKKKNRASFL